MSARYRCGMPEGLLIAGAVVSGVGTIVAAVIGVWTLVDRIAAARQKRREKRAEDYNVEDSYL